MNVRRRRTMRRAITSVTTGTALTVGGLFLAAPPAAAATTAAFIPSIGVLKVIGDNQDNTLTISSDAGGAILVNGGAIPISGGNPTVSNTRLIQVFGLGGSDAITLSEVNGALPRANLFGGSDADVLTAGSGDDQLFGQAGNDTLNGAGGFDQLFGGSENDTLTGGDADDQAFGEAGNDRMIWNPGEDTDLNEGGAGTDTVEVNGGGTENFRATANGARVRFDRISPAPFSVDIGTSENLVLNAGGGDDQFDTVGSLAPLIKVTVDGGVGEDVVRGSDGNDVLLGGDGDDFIDGENGDDVAFLGAGDDTFQWDPGDDNDVVEGQGETDRMVFNGSNANEKIDISANGGRVRFFRDVAAVTMDVNDLEGITFNALNGADDVTVNDVSGTDLTDVVTDLAAAGTSAPDGSADVVRVSGTNGEDIAQVSGDSAEQQVTGLAAQVTVLRADAPPIDRIDIETADGSDVVDATALTAPAALSAAGGAGDDVLLGGTGDDSLAGDDGDDVLIGGDGFDTLDGGAGDDILLGGEVVTDGLVATKAWLAKHARTVRGDTVLDLGHKQLTVPGISLGSLS